MGAHRFLLVITRSTGATHLYQYDASTHVTSALLGVFGDFVGIDPSVIDDTYAYFSAQDPGLDQSSVYRVRLDGTAIAQALMGSDVSGAYSTKVLAVVGGSSFYLQPGASSTNVLSVSTSTSFAAPSASVTVVEDGYPAAFSSNRIFFAVGNFAAVARLDGSDREESTDVARWIGCTSATDHVLPSRVALCERVVALNPFSKNPTMVSYDADAGSVASGGFFANSLADAISLGNLAGYVNAPSLATDVEPRFVLRPGLRFAGTYQTKSTIPEAFHDTIFHAPNVTSANGLTYVTGSLASPVVWLSRL